ncbi:hypothetical protein HB762_10205 [Vibrio campbellii]|uniref:Uncharacterized protein n=1 Tax=Vibrio campbellii TaxID=680 RepID=A0ABY5IEK7_9VIBR|nr:hypothetical protein [Vibrio campbellii]PQJ39110.1 hypothetical protein BTO00_22405 [Vibrio campbellii]UTZ31738.1 hypothetical protein HB762_10205 [Vibrio campbellii]
MLPNLGSLNNSGSMPISGGHAGPSTSKSENRAGLSVGGINMGGGISPVLLFVFILIMAYMMMRFR